MLRVHDLSYRYKDSDTKTLKNISFSIKQGELVVLTGRSGCGKSTVFRCVNGLCPNFYEGEKERSVFLKGQKNKTLRICDISRIVASVFQNPENQFFTTDVLSDLVYACENYSVSKEEITKQLENVISTLSLSPLVGRKLSELSAGEKQKVAIASALMLKANIMLLDEPSSNLDYQSIELLKETLEHLKSKGYTILVIEHRLYYLADLCDSLIVLNHGKIVYTYTGEELRTVSDNKLHQQGLRGLHLFQNPIRKLNPQRDSSPQNKTNPQRNTSLLRNTNPLLVLDNIVFGYKKNIPILNNICFRVYPGDRIALIGKNGCGKTTLGKIMCGLIKEQKGSLRCAEKTLSARDRNRSVSYVMQNIDFQLFGCSVYDDLLLGNEKKPGIEKSIRDVLSWIHLSDLESQHPTTLSMGQKQRLVVAASYLLNKKINVFDEPTSGLDYENMKSVCNLIEAITGREGASIVITHDYEFIVSVCNRIILLENGEIVKDFILSDTAELEHIFKKHL